MNRRETSRWRAGGPRTTACLGPRVLLLLLWLAGLAGNVDALEPGKAIAQYRQDVWTESDGLPQASVQAITQTKDGYLWIGTRDGLVRFDGVRFTIFNAEDVPGLGANDIRALYQDREGNLWIGTFNGGVSRYRDGRFTLYTKADGLPNNGVLEILQDREGAIWMGTWSGAVRWFEGQIRAVYRSSEGLLGESAWSLCEDRDGTIWIGTSRGLNRLRDGQISALTERDGLSHDSVRAVYVDRRGVLWLGSIGGGLMRLEGGRFTHYSTRHGLADDRVRTILQDSKGNLWIGTWKGLSRLQNGEITSYTPEDGLPHPFVEALFEDSEGSLWVGTRGGGLARLRDGKFTIFSQREGLASNQVKSVYEARDGSVWIGSNGGGVSCLRNGKVTNYTTEHGLVSNFVRAIGEDSDGNLWVGTGQPASLSQFADGKFRTLTEAEGFKIEHRVRAVFGDRSGNLWIGGDQGGLCRYRDGQFRYFGAEDGLPSPLIRVIKEDREGNLWLGTEAGLCRFREGVIRNFTTADGLAHDAVYSIHEDSEGTLWLGTQRGLSRYRDGRFCAYTTADGLAQDLVYQALEDDTGKLWMSSNRGIFSISKGQLNSFAAGRVSKISCALYGVADGMKTAQCEGGAQPAGWRLRDGRLCFPTMNGLALLDPNVIRRNERPPPVHIEKVLVRNSPIDLARPAQLGPQSREFRFQYTALSYVAPERVRFRYRLEGLDPDWVEAETRRFAVYNELPPGNYRFRVIACNNDGIWNEAGASFAFSLEPHFYQTVWFYLLCGAGVGVAGWTFHRARMRRAQAQFSLVLEERIRIARELHDTLAQGFAGIAFQLEAVATKLTETPDQAQRHLDVALTMVRHSLGEARRSVMNLRSSALENGDLATALLETARQLMADRMVEVEVQTMGTTRALPLKIENTVLRVGQEAITNSLRHSKAGKLKIQLDYNSSRITLKVEDNGEGFDVVHSRACNGAHFGLLGMEERAKQIGARLEVMSQPGSGTAVVLEVPIQS